MQGRLDAGSAVRCGRPAEAGRTRLTRCSTVQIRSGGEEEVGGKDNRHPQTALLQWQAQEQAQRPILTTSSEGASEAEERLACMRLPPAPAVLLVRCNSAMAPADSRASWLPPAMLTATVAVLVPGPMLPAASAAAVSAAAARSEASAAAAAAAALPCRSKVPCRLNAPGCCCCWPSVSAPEEERRCSLLGADRQPAGWKQEARSTGGQDRFLSGDAHFPLTLPRNNQLQPVDHIAKVKAATGQMTQSAPTCIDDP